MSPTFHSSQDSGLQVTESNLNQSKQNGDHISSYNETARKQEPQSLGIWWHKDSHLPSIHPYIPLYANLILSSLFSSQG